MKRLFSILLVILSSTGAVMAQSAKFNFSATTATVSGWTNVTGDPSVAVVSASSSGITLSSIATANWVPFNGGSAFNAVGENTGNTYFPGGVLYNHWFQYGSDAEYNAAVPQLLISGLSPDSTYTIIMAGSSTSSLNTNPVQYTAVGLTVYPSQYENNHNNTTNFASFNVTPDTTGKVRLYLNTQPTTDVADISGLIITGGTVVPMPVDSITSPVNGAVLSEDGNLLLTATASVSSGTITKVEFYHDTTKIGQVTAAPYNLTWYNPDPGNYQLIAKATDYLGRSVSSSIHISIESPSSFWSMTGNIATNGDSNFVGTVDTNRLSFRTNNVERMTILKDGTIGIGTKTTYGYSLAVNGTAIFTKAKVKTAGTWPDYVFKKDYRLPGLTELEQYIFANHHLPGVDPASIVQKEGIDLGDQQTVLLKKVEELTLYLIQQNKLLSDQNTRLEAQQKEIDELKALIKDKK